MYYMEKPNDLVRLLRGKCVEQTYHRIWITLSIIYCIALAANSREDIIGEGAANQHL
jgi:hypothetical protein